MGNKWKDISYSCARALVCAEFFRNNISKIYFSIPDEALEFAEFEIRSIKKGKWTFDVKKFLTFDEEQIKKGKYKIEKKKLLWDKKYILVIVGNKYGNDKFFILRENELQNIIYDKFTKWVNPPGERRIWFKEKIFREITIDDIKQYENKWEVCSKLYK